MTTTPVIPELTLSRLERTVKRLMDQGRWQQAITQIRQEAAELGVPSDDLVKAVIGKGFERGHVRPIQLVDHLELDD